MRRRLGYVVGAAATTALLLLLVPVERARLDRLAAVAVLVVSLVALRRGVGGCVRPRSGWTPPADDPGPPDALAVRLSRLEASLRYAGDSRGQYERAVRPLLAGLAADRLRQRHGIEATADPARARELVGEELWQTLSTPIDRDADGPGPPPAELERLLSRIETL